MLCAAASHLPCTVTHERQKDIDFLIPSDEIEPAFDALKTAGFTLRAGSIPLGTVTPTPQRRFRATKAFEGRHLTVDLLEMTASYEPAWKSREIRNWNGRLLTVVSRQCPIEMKQLSTRLKDRADIEALENTDEE